MGYPVVVHLISETGIQHWVTVIGYSGEGKELENFRTIDPWPWGGSSDLSSVESKKLNYCTLNEHCGETEYDYSFNDDGDIRVDKSVLNVWSQTHTSGYTTG